MLAPVRGNINSDNNEKKDDKILFSCFLISDFFVPEIAFSQKINITFPNSTWEESNLVKSGWSERKLKATKSFFDSLPPASLLVIDKGKVVINWGSDTMRIKISSMRKSLLSCLYGIHVNDGDININKKLEELGVDDNPPLAPEEKQATIKMLLQARSGIYHSYVAGTPAMRSKMPVRGSHQPGTFWYYNNWDFNTLGSIFEKQTHIKIASAFYKDIAVPLHMRDFREQDMYYLYAAANAPDYEKSVYPAYHFRMSARDLARFGYFYLCKGNWDGKQIVPADWITESTQSYSVTNDGGGYGFLWWVNNFGPDIKCFSAEGALGKYIIVIPERNLVIVYLNHTEFPDNTQNMSDDDIKKLPTETNAQMNQLLRMLLTAQQFKNTPDK